MNPISSSTDMARTVLDAKHLVLLSATLLAATTMAPLHAGGSSCSLNVNYCDYTAAADEGNERLVVRAYDGDDGAHLIASDDATLSVGDSAKLSCSDDSACDIAAEVYGTVATASGYHQYACDKDVYVDVEASVNYTQAGTTYSYDYSFSSSGCP